MIGMAGDDKNKGSLIINVQSEPSEQRKSENPNLGLVIAAREILKAIDSNDADTLASALKSLINMCNMESKQSKFESELSEKRNDPKQETRNRIGKGY